MCFVCYFLCNYRTMYDKCARNCDSSGHSNGHCGSVRFVLWAIYFVVNCLVWFGLVSCAAYILSFQCYCSVVALLDMLLFCFKSHFSIGLAPIVCTEVLLLFLVAVCYFKTLIFALCLFIIMIILKEGRKKKCTHTHTHEKRAIRISSEYGLNMTRNSKVLCTCVWHLV